MPALPPGERRRVRRLRTREVVPKSEFPNFRDHGRTVDRALLDLIARLQKRYGEAFASEASLRRMVCEDTDFMPGLDTIRRALTRLERQGLLEQHWLRAGGERPDGLVCTHGTRLIVIYQCRRDRRAMRARAQGRAGEQRRVQRRMLHTLEQVRAAAFQPRELAPEGDARAAALEEKRRRDTERARELEAQFAAEDLARGLRRPPD